MAYISYINFWECEFDHIVFKKKDKVQFLNINQLKLEARDS